MAFFQRQIDLLQIGKHYGQVQVQIIAHNRLANELPTGFHPPCGPLEGSQVPGATSPFEFPPRTPSDSIFQNQMCDFFPNSSSTLHLESRPRSHPGLFLCHTLPLYSFTKVCGFHLLNIPPNYPASPPSSPSPTLVQVTPSHLDQSSSLHMPRVACQHPLCFSQPQSILF